MRVPRIVRRAAAWVARKAWKVAVGARSSFEGAKGGRLTWDWVTRVLSADEHVRRDLLQLRARSRDLVRNNGYATRFLRMVQRNVAGPAGIQLKAANVDRNGELLEDINRAIEEAWKDWGHPENCSADGKHSWAEIQNLAAAAEAGDGEYILQMVPAFEDSPYRFAVRFVDPDLLDHNLNRPRGREGNEIRMGIEVNEWGRPVAYHFLPRRALAMGAAGASIETSAMKHTRVEAIDIVHGFVPIPGRVNQTRGVPWLSPSMFDMKMLGGYHEAEVVAARTAAAKMGFIYTEPGDEGTYIAQDPELSSEEGDEGEELQAEPGTLMRLGLGEKFASWDPEHPTTAFGDFTKAMLRSVASGLDVAYNGLANDLEGVSWSSIRTGKQDEQDGWRTLQAHLAIHLCRRVYRRWLRFALLSGELELPTMDASAYERAFWRPRGWDWVDPLKEIQAEIIAVENGLTSRTRLCQERGEEFEEVMKQLRREQEIAEEYGITFGGLKPVVDTSGGSGNGNGSKGTNGNGRGGAGAERGEAFGLLPFGGPGDRRGSRI